MAKTGVEYYNGTYKRVIDASAATIAGGLLLAPAGIAYTGACIDNRTIAPFFRQKRQGQFAAAVELIKLRSLQASKTTGEVITYGTDDPRATKIGQFIRSSSLDEYPQLLQVVRGELSLNGPRLCVDGDLEKLKSAAPRLFPYYLDACSELKRPGLTGVSQIFRRQFSELTPEVMKRSMELDIEWIENVNPFLDLALMATTLPLLVAAARAHHNQATVVLPQSQAA